MQFAVVGSGSKGNCSLVKTATSLVMVDCGFALRETVKRLAELNVQPEQLDAILVTHEHSDHIAGVAKLANKYQIPIYLTHGTQHYFIKKNIKLIAKLNFLQLETPFNIGDLSILPVPVPHDAKEPCQFVFQHQNKKLGVLSDLGHISSTVSDAYQDCDTLFIECNHDKTMLANGPYPAMLKQRVSGAWGHLSNCQTVAFVKSLRDKGLQQLLVGHISEKNNADDLVKQSLLEIDFLNTELILAPQHTVQPWVAVA